MSVTYREETQLIYHLPIFLQLLIIDRILLLFVWLVYIYYRILVVYHGNSSLEFLERGTNQSWRSSDIDNSMYWSQHSPLKRASNKLHDRLQCLGRGRTISFASNRQRNRNLEFYYFQSFSEHTVNDHRVHSRFCDGQTLDAFWAVLISGMEGPEPSKSCVQHIGFSTERDHVDKSAIYTVYLKDSITNKFWNTCGTALRSIRSNSRWANGVLTMEVSWTYYTSECLLKTIFGGSMSGNDS